MVADHGGLGHGGAVDTSSTGPGACDICGEAHWEMEVAMRRRQQKEDREREQKEYAEKHARETAQYNRRKILNLDGKEKCRRNNCSMHAAISAQPYSYGYQGSRQKFRNVIRELHIPIPQWPWIPTYNGNGTNVTFALIRVWAGRTSGHFGWSIQAHKGTPDESTFRRKFTGHRPANLREWHPASI